MTEGDPIAPAPRASEPPPDPGACPLFVLAFFLVPFAVLTTLTYRLDTRTSPLTRSLRAALFSFLVLEALDLGITLGGLIAAASAVLIFNRFIRPTPG